MCRGTLWFGRYNLDFFSLNGKTCIQGDIATQLYPIGGRVGGYVLLSVCMLWLGHCCQGPAEVVRLGVHADHERTG